MKDFVLGTIRGMGFARYVCNTNEKLAINRTINKNLKEEEPNEKNISCISYLNTAFIYDRL